MPALGSRSRERFPRPVEARARGKKFVSYQNAKKIAETWIQENMPADLHGRAVQLIDFADDATCRFFYGDRPLKFHRMITTAIARAARKRGAEQILYVEVKRTDFMRDRIGIEFPRSPIGTDTSSARAYAESCHRFL